MGEMAPMKAMKAMKGGAKPMSKGALAEALAGECELKRKECAKVVGTLAEIAATQVKSVGKFVLPGVCMVKTRLKPATKAGKREVFGKVVMVFGAAGQDRGEGLPCVRLEEAVLRLESVGFATSDQGPFV